VATRRQQGALRRWQSALFATVTTASSDGAVNSMRDSFMPLSGLVPVGQHVMLDEVIVGSPSSSLFVILLFAIVAVFAAGLMIGRTPEYLGKKIDRRRRGQDDHAGAAMCASVHPGHVGGGLGVALVACPVEQCRTAWLLRVAVCLYVGCRD
jgi:K+-transporting ATPase A subunit